MRGKKVNNYIEDATDNAATNDKFDSTTTALWTVPSGKRWFLMYGSISRDTSSTLTIKLYDSSDKLIGMIDSKSAATGDTPFTGTGASATVAKGKQYWVLDAGEYVKLTFGAAQGASATASCVVIEVDA